MPLQYMSTDYHSFIVDWDALTTAIASEPVTEQDLWNDRRFQTDISYDDCSSGARREQFVHHYHQLRESISLRQQSLCDEFFGSICTFGDYHEKPKLNIRVTETAGSLQNTTAVLSPNRVAQLLAISESIDYLMFRCANLNDFGNRFDTPDDMVEYAKQWNAPLRLASQHRHGFVLGMFY